MNDLVYRQKGDFFLAGPMREIANAPRVANQKTGFPSFCSLTDSAIYRELKQQRF